MTSNESWRRYLDAGAAVGQVTLARAEEIARGLLAPEEATRERARRDLDNLGRTSRVVGGQLVELARHELTKQVKTIGSFDHLVDRIAEVLGQPRRPSGPDAATDVPEPATGRNVLGSTGAEPEGAASEIQQPSAEEPTRTAADLGSADELDDKKHEKKQKAAKKKDSTVTKAKSKHNGKNKNKHNGKNKERNRDDSKSHRNRPAASAPASNRVLTLASPLDSPGRP